jgi:hypothetical protein
MNMQNVNRKSMHVMDTYLDKGICANHVVA